MAETIFTRIMRGEIPADIVYEDELCVAFRDIHPQAPTHVLIVPRDPIAGIQEATPEREQILGRLLLVARRVAEQEGVAESGYRCVINAGPQAGQEVQHLHIHLLGGRSFTWPPG
ncbi:MAG: histidine triad nucleotide-binding protein [Candidatus Latescibacterota bacterium]